MNYSGRSGPVKGLFFLLVLVGIIVSVVLFTLLVSPLVYLARSLTDLTGEETAKPAIAVAPADKTDHVELDPVKVTYAEERLPFILDRAEKIERAFDRGYEVGAYAAELLERWRCIRDDYLGAHPEMKEKMAGIEARLNARLHA